jgi:N-acetylglucosamine-6-phosphate deacetylase
MRHLTALLAGTIYTPLQEISEGVVLIEGTRIVRVGPKGKVKVPRGAQVMDHRDEIIVPGFIDLHIHGAAGHEFMEGTSQAISSVANFLAQRGTTSFVATTVTASFDDTLSAVRAMAQAIRAQRSFAQRRDEPVGAEILGIHFEGPFLNRKRRGAQPANYVRLPSVSLLRRLLEAAEGNGRILTLAPELEGALPLLKYARRRGLRVSIGHSDATLEEAERAINAGATHATHTFNAMRPFTHRDPGIIGAVLTDDRVCAELICDGIHVHPGAVRLLARSKGLERMVLVSDGGTGTGMPDGEYRISNFAVSIIDGVCRNRQGNLAGSTVTLDVELRNLMKYSGQPYARVLPCATLNPARVLGLEKRKGLIAPGADADLVALDPEYRVVQCYVGGRPVPHEQG